MFCRINLYYVKAKKAFNILVRPARICWKALSLSNSIKENQNFMVHHNRPQFVRFYSSLFKYNVDLSDPNLCVCVFVMTVPVRCIRKFLCIFFLWVFSCSALCVFQLLSLQLMQHYVYRYQFQGTLTLCYAHWSWTHGTLMQHYAYWSRSHRILEYLNWIVELNSWIEDSSLTLWEVFSRKTNLSFLIDYMLGISSYVLFPIRSPNQVIIVP